MPMMTIYPWQRRHASSWERAAALVSMMQAFRELFLWRAAYARGRDEFADQVWWAAMKSGVNA